MSEGLALASAALFGFGDFLGGFVTRRLSAWKVMLWSQLLGLPVLAAGFLVVRVEEVTAGDFLFGALSGLAGAIGIVLFYTALARGTMSVVAPVTGATGAALPVLFDLVTGVSLTGREWTGVGIGILAVTVLGLDLTKQGTGRESFLLAVAAGASFALFFIAFAQTDDASGLWPAAAARMVSVPLAAIVAVGLRNARLPSSTDIPLVAGAGGLDMAANVFILLALQRGTLAVGTVLSSLYPAFTALAAIVLLRERPSLTQFGGIALALGAVVALSV